MGLRESFSQWATDFAVARVSPFGKNATAEWIRANLRDAVESSAKPVLADYIVKGSAGAGNWAQVTWVSIFDPSVTDSATRGFYVVYLLSEDGTQLHLSLNQGTTVVTEEFGARARTILRERASFMRQRISDFLDSLPVTEIHLAGQSGLPAGYAAGHAMGKTYITAALPTEAQLVSDLHVAIAAYRALVFRGGLDLDIREDDGPGDVTVDELLQYRMHRRIERNPKAARLVKRYHGDSCQACGMNFETSYGELGKGFIEAHHLKPIASLKEGAGVAYSVATDFAVLCANCHRMIHKMVDPSDLPGLIKLVRAHNRMTSF